MKQTLSIARKELSSYFGSPMAMIFVGAFLAATLFVFFWVDGFFARGIADVRPLFAWMPVLMIFLVAALTMRQWSEESRSGTLEMLLTLPISKFQLVLGKFLAVMALIVLALALTFFLPLTTSLLGNLDWGPVIGGYLAAILMSAAYAAIGLFVSSRTDNQIVSLMLSVLVSGAFYMIGSRGVTDFVGGSAGDILRAFGAGSRFESIERGVIDLRDLVYYLSLTGLFLLGNMLSLDGKRWSRGERTLGYRRNAMRNAVLIALNLAMVNVWLYPLSMLRVDLTSQHQYTLSSATKDLVGNLQEPLLIRGYFSQKTHPLLAPLVPQVRDMLREYEIAGRGKVVIDVVDPASSPDKEAEANQSYGIQPTPLQISGRREASVINAYFDLLVRYGDQNVTLNFRDLIQTEQTRDGSIDVQLRNMEYDLTRAIKKAVYGFQSVDSMLAALNQPVKLLIFATPGTLPAELQAAPAMMQKVATDLQGKSAGKFSFQLIDPDAANAPLNRQKVLDTYKLRPLQASLFSDQSYYLDMVLQVGDKPQVLYPNGELSEATVRSAIEAALKRSTSGFLKVVGVWQPPQQPTQNMFGQQQQPLTTFQQAQQQLQKDYSVRPVDLSTGQVASDVDVLLLLSPQGFTDKERFAVDQYLMRGGAVIVAGGSFVLAPDQMTGSLTVQPVENGLQEMLASYGVKVENSMVMDPQNEPFPVPVDRKVGNTTVREIQSLNYPFFVDVRPTGMDRTSPVVASLPAVTLNWASPLTVDEAKNKDRKVSTLLKSTANSWLRATPDIQPDVQKYPNVGFPVEGEKGARTLAVAIQGRFDSYFKGKASPLQNQPQPTPAPGQAPVPTPQAAVGSTLDTSPDTARLMVIGSGEFLNDLVFQISANLSQGRYLNSLQFLQNATDWSVEDLDLLTIRSRGTQSHVLMPLSEGTQSFWEWLNYGLALVALLVIGVTWNLRKRREKPMTLPAPSPDAMGTERLAKKGI